jgi:metallo-beta-lactamase family protein
MKIKPIGASGGEVTGSAYLIRTKRACILVDAGLFQGGRQSEAKNRLPQGAQPHEIEAVLLTHAHLDHTGRLPLLMRHGFRGTIFATGATIDLAEIILKDCARIQSQDAQRKSRKAAKLKQPLYEPEDVEPYRSLTRQVQFQKPTQVADGITARWVEAGHMLGSGCIELTVEEDGKKKVVVFSGDLGPTTLPLIRQFETFQHADAVFLESTYGDRLHRPYAQTVAEFERIVKQVAKTSGKILVPTFAIAARSRCSTTWRSCSCAGPSPFPRIPRQPDGPGGHKNLPQIPRPVRRGACRLAEEGPVAAEPLNFKPSVTANDSKAINDVPGPCVVLAGAGMCNAGRILHHLKANLDKPTTHVLIVGYQGHGSLGRRLVEGQKVVTIFGERIPVQASVHTLNGFSGHADQSELLKWFSTLAPAKPKVFLTHGEDSGRGALMKLIQQRFKLTAALPRQGEVIEI